MRIRDSGSAVSPEQVIPTMAVALKNPPRAVMPRQTRRRARCGPSCARPPVGDARSRSPLTASPRRCHPEPRWQRPKPRIDQSDQADVVQPPSRASGQRNPVVGTALPSLMLSPRAPAPLAELLPPICNGCTPS